MRKNGREIDLTTGKKDISTNFTVRTTGWWYSLGGAFEEALPGHVDGDVVPICSMNGDPSAIA